MDYKEESKIKGKAVTVKTTTTPPDKADVRLQNDLARRISPEYFALLNAIAEGESKDES